MYLVYPILLMQESGHSMDESRIMLTATLWVTGLITIVQALPGRYAGSGFLAVQVANPIFLPLSLEAVRAGGPGLLAGLMAVTGFAQVLFARVFHKLRTVFPTEVCGVVILMLGVSMVGVAAKRCTGYHLNGEIISSHLAISGTTLGIIIGLTIWGKGAIRLFAVGIGIAAGYLISLALGVITTETFSPVAGFPAVAVPSFELPDFNLNLTLLLPFLITGVISSLDSAGGLIMCQKMNDSNWLRPDLKNLGRGILVDGLGNFFAGLSGAFGIGVAGSNIGLAMATGAASRRIAYVTGLFLILLTLFPRVTGALVLIPPPVMGAVLVYAAAFLIVSGAQITMFRMMDDRRTAMIGMALFAGLSVEIVPGLFQSAPVFLKPLLSSSIAVTALTAIVLNLLFRLGIAQKTELVCFSHKKDSQAVFNFMEKSGAAWGAREDVIQKAALALNECIELLQTAEQAETLNITASYDEYNVDILLAYAGRVPALSAEKPSPERILDDENGAALLAGYMIQRLADRATTKQNGSNAELRLHFDH
jgi:NCS2 family nucleobase:cation symporter-2